MLMLVNMFHIVIYVFNLTHKLQKKCLTIVD